MTTPQIPSTRKKTRAAKAAAGETPTPKPVEVSKIANKLNEFKPTPAQQEFSNKIRDNVVTFVNSCAGTGKTVSTLWTFAKEYIRDSSLQIVVTRAPAEVGKDKIGFLPNDADSKLEPHFASTKKLLEDLIGREKVNADLGKRIHFTIPNFLLGATMSNTLWLIDEAQLMQPIIMKLLLERIGDNTKVVVSGSASQIYTGDNGRGGMQDAIDRFFKKDGTPKYKNFALHKFSVDDVMRSDVVKDVLRAYEGE